MFYKNPKSLETLAISNAQNFTSFDWKITLPNLDVNDTIRPSNIMVLQD